MLALDVSIISTKIEYKPPNDQKRQMINSLQSTRRDYIGEFSRQNAWCCYMTTFYDIPADMLIPALADKLSELKDIEQPEWSD